MSLISNRISVTIIENFNKQELISSYEDREVLNTLLSKTYLNFGFGVSDAANPLIDLINPGMKVLLKPNWVLHYNQAGKGMECMITNKNVLLVLIEQILKCNPAEVKIADAPIQGCEWDLIVDNHFKSEVKAIDPRNVVSFVDLRKKVLKMNSDALSLVEQRSDSDFVLFDLGSDSMLEKVTKGKCFRVTMYDPDLLHESHKKGRHLYMIAREAFEADVIINVPKLKTHRKTAFTGALKNLVGVVGSKDYLPHHRVGGSAFGGDCYKGFSPLKRLTEFFLDKANRQMGQPDYNKWKDLAFTILNQHRKLFADDEIEGGWYGNDTIWRTVLDIDRILIYGRKDGTLSDKPMREIWNLTDGIICGEGEGPLSPEPLYVGALTFSNSLVNSDIVNATLLGIDYKKIPIFSCMHQNYRYPLPGNDETLEISLNGLRISLGELKKLSRMAKPPRGWINHCEIDNSL